MKWEHSNWLCLPPLKHSQCSWQPKCSSPLFGFHGTPPFLGRPPPAFPPISLGWWSAPGSSFCAVGVPSVPAASPNALGSWTDLCTEGQFNSMVCTILFPVAHLALSIRLCLSIIFPENVCSLISFCCALQRVAVLWVTRDETGAATAL